MLSTIRNAIRPFFSKSIRQVKKNITSIRSKLDNKITPEQEALLYEKKTAFALASKKNPYLQSKAMWNDLYGSVQSRLENAHRIIFILSSVIAIAIIGFIIVASQTKVKSVPFIIHGNEVLTADNASFTESSHLKPALALYFIKNFIRDARTVSADGDINALHKIAAFSFATDSAIQTLKDFYLKNDPDQIANHFVKSVKITSVLRASPHTVDVRWQENWRNLNSGELVRSHRFIAEITYHYSDPAQNTTILRYNPLGLQIRYLSWSIDQNV
jgi:type IV secretion system protein TrbF